MTPTEKKAREIYERFMFASIYFTDKENGAKLNAKQCALICIDELIDATDYSKPYWQEVKTHIEKL